MSGEQYSSTNFQRVINKQPWKFNRQIAGFKTIYSKGLTFITVRGMR
jgi:hypothetical protein